MLWRVFNFSSLQQRSSGLIGLHKAFRDDAIDCKHSEPHMERQGVLHIAETPSIT